VSYCSSNIINHFYCDNLPLLALSCTDTYIPEITVFISAGTNMVFFYEYSYSVIFRHCFVYSKDTVIRRKEKSIFYLCFTYNGCHVKAALKRLMANPFCSLKLM
jgi:hypothetical protein